MPTTQREARVIAANTKIQPFTTLRQEVLTIGGQGTTRQGTCEESYIGETERSLGTRFLEHKRPSSLSSEVSQHIHIESPGHTVSLDKSSVVVSRRTVRATSWRSSAELRAVRATSMEVARAATITELQTAVMSRIRYSIMAAVRLSVKMKTFKCPSVAYRQRCLDLEPRKLREWFKSPAFIAWQSSRNRYIVAPQARPHPVSLEELERNLPCHHAVNLRHAERNTQLFYTEHWCRHIRLCPVRAKLPAPANDAGFRTVETISVHGGSLINLRHAERDTLLFYTEHRCWHIRLCPVRAKLPAPANDAGFRTVETISVHGGSLTLHDDKHSSYSRIQSRSGTKYQVNVAMATLRCRLQQEFTG
ncbi:hypothetical protein Bbelb_314340 [Branchiostoma belcheri]|nr:hypothetical protein Bbelb_314340 [Branchiostoma belcheri]